ncbi:MAM domain-containing protein 2-like isoform X2 [Girardinichthys multiradiatus]|uniref:MAM domain-containing protein 2-like isoform X2 n=1 Tax=Girardinichthys multiradiatus TaxID=208333 RepID=UPI001FAD9738|nr:MAM domain-containing protein 2-like isoform X2 [Girardinichthys multiradiatus]
MAFFLKNKAAMLQIYLLTFVATAQAHSRLLPGSCNFESNTCGFTSDADFTSWVLHRDGHFVAVEAVNDDVEGSSGSDVEPKEEVLGFLLSPFLEHDEWSCMRLVYQITESAYLEVLQRNEGRSFDKPLWSSQAPSDSWVIASVDLQNSSEPFRIVINGRAGPSAGSSVAVFEIHISPGYCLECDFEEPHLCGYNNQWNVNVNWYVGGGGVQLPYNNMPDDHTYHNKTGHFMYVDSSYTKTFREVAKLVSPMATMPLSGCLSFQYQRSEERGNLFSVFTRDRLGQYQELWRAGLENRVDFSSAPGEWIHVQVDLKAPYSVQVVFEVGFNSPRGGHVALDDISFSPEFCNTDTEPTFDPSIANCDFESGLCLYTQDRAIGSSWRRVSVKPNIFSNGDHTTGAGSFLLAHSRLGPRSGYVSSVISPTLPGNTKFCLRFYFSLRGFNQTEQALAVYLLQQGGKREKIWTQAEKSRGIWILADVTFQTSQPAKMVFVSTCRSFWDCGSVALDDISLNLGDCDLTAGFLSSSFSGHCDFESGLCGYTQDKRRDSADWQRRRGSTPTSYTGPRGDHTTGLGYYMYIEASPMLPGQSARLLSRPIRGTRGPQCLRFYYHMYGSRTGELRVLADKDGEEELLWQRSGEQSIAWLRAHVGYQSQRQHQIVFEATRGSSVRSDIAIDDIMLESGPCPDMEVGDTVGSSNEIE